MNGLLLDTWTKVVFERISKNEEQALINLIHSRRAYREESKHCRKIRIKRFKSTTLTFLYYFSYKWSYIMSFDVILVGLENRHSQLSSDIFYTLYFFKRR